MMSLDFYWDTNVQVTASSKCLWPLQSCLLSFLPFADLYLRCLFLVCPLGFWHTLIVETCWPYACHTALWLTLISQPCLVLSSAGISGMCHLHCLIFNINYVDRFHSSLQGIYWFIILFFYCNCFCCHCALFSGNLIPGITKRQSFYYHLTETII